MTLTSWYNSSHVLAFSLHAISEGNGDRDTQKRRHAERAGRGREKPSRLRTSDVVKPHIHHTHRPFKGHSPAKPHTVPPRADTLSRRPCRHVVTCRFSKTSFGFCFAGGEVDEKRSRVQAEGGGRGNLCCY